MKTLEEYLLEADELDRIEDKAQADRDQLLEQFVADYATQKIGDIMDIDPGIYSDGRTRFRIDTIKGYFGAPYLGRRVSGITYYGSVLRKDGSVGSRPHSETVRIRPKP